MMGFDRRSVLKGGAALGLAGTSLLDFAKAWAQLAPFKPETGAALNVLRWKRFVQAEADACKKMVGALPKAPGGNVSIRTESLHATHRKASVAANTGQGPGMV